MSTAFSRWVGSTSGDRSLTFAELESREKDDDVGEAIGALSLDQVARWTLADAIGALPTLLFDEPTS